MGCLQRWMQTPSWGGGGGGVGGMLETEKHFSPLGLNFLQDNSATVKRLLKG